MTNTYIFNPEDGVEMARLIHQDRIVTKGMGGPLAGLPDLPENAQVLDVCCGPGGWVLDLAYLRSDLQVAGIDVSRMMIDYAQARAQTQQIHNTSFGVMDVLKPLDFSNNCFDLVNARFLIAVLQRGEWPKLIQELYRVTKPDGMIRLTEGDSMGTTTSFAFAELSQKAYQASKVIGYGFSPDGRSLGITQMLGQFLQKVGCENIQNKMHVVDFSANSGAWADVFHNYEIAFKAIQPLLIKQNIATQEELDQLYEQFLVELHLDEFRGVWPYMSVWGTKPQLQKKQRKSAV